jgi:hypothetical protein
LRSLKYFKYCSFLRKTAFSLKAFEQVVLWLCLTNKGLMCQGIVFFLIFSAPQPMVKPDFYGVVKSAEIQVILPQASEEYGPISHYYLIVVPEDKLNAQKNPDQFLTEEASSAVSCLSACDLPIDVISSWYCVALNGGMIRE